MCRAASCQSIRFAPHTVVSSSDEASRCPEKEADFTHSQSH